MGEGWDHKTCNVSFILVWCLLSLQGFFFYSLLFGRKNFEDINLAIKIYRFSDLQDALTTRSGDAGLEQSKLCMKLEF